MQTKQIKRDFKQTIHSFNQYRKFFYIKELSRKKYCGIIILINKLKHANTYIKMNSTE